MGDSQLHYDVGERPTSNHVMEMLQTRVQLWRDTELVVFMDVAVQYGI